MDGAAGQVRSTGFREDELETCAAEASETPSLQHVVDEEALLQLMKSCPMCDRKCRCSKHTRGPYFIVYQSCYFCHYQRKWASQPEARNVNTHGARRKLRPRDESSSSQPHKANVCEPSEANEPSEARRDCQLPQKNTC